MSNMNTIDVEAVVKQVLESMMNGGAASGISQASGKTSGGSVPKTARVAMLTALEKYEVKEFPIPEVGDGDILVKVEAAASAAPMPTNLRETPSGSYR